MECIFNVVLEIVKVYGLRRLRRLRGKVSGRAAGQYEKERREAERAGRRGERQLIRRLRRTHSFTF